MRIAYIRLRIVNIPDQINAGATVALQMAVY